MKREPFSLSRGSIQDSAGVVIAYAPDDDMLTARAQWRQFAQLLAASPRLANALEECERLVRKGDLYELKKIFKSAEMQQLLISIERKI